jgi:hypothetical protein
MLQVVQKQMRKKSHAGGGGENEAYCPGGYLQLAGHAFFGRN